MTGSSLTSLVETLSELYGTELVLEREKGESQTKYGIRFVGLHHAHTFKLSLARTWKSSVITLTLDPFAKILESYLASRLMQMAPQVRQLLADSPNSYSSVWFKLDGHVVDLATLNTRSVPSSIGFEADLLLEQSNVGLGFASQQEVGLISLGVEVMMTLLGVEKVAFRNADEVLGYPEGAKKTVEVNRFERDPRNRLLAINFHGTTCLSCGFNFENVYGGIGRGFTIIHHIVPVSQIGPDYVIDPTQDLVSICANCHAMAHRREPPFSIQELRDLIGMQIAFQAKGGLPQ